MGWPAMVRGDPTAQHALPRLNHEALAPVGQAVAAKPRAFFALTLPVPFRRSTRTRPSQLRAEPSCAHPPPLAACGLLYMVHAQRAQCSAVQCSAVQCSAHNQQ